MVIISGNMNYSILFLARASPSCSNFGFISYIYFNSLYILFTSIGIRIIVISLM
jgi:hypothetical protein